MFFGVISGEAVGILITIVIPVLSLILFPYLLIKEKRNGIPHSREEDYDHREVYLVDPYFFESHQDKDTGMSHAEWVQMDAAKHHSQSQQYDADWAADMMDEKDY